eukprot:gnl/TRDRNA2_/TRDRNA2_91017_c0_seq1.p2 gnl/TRDRNA2_/TRDRNA2_91017_c0~~gnl/TRDRNA2_/TRDRNA2_91017_c0_seq1.p2  ORF type:complete len:136 (-),score=23.02 gnl/TRDRNA2_/TRDRNA2_91017_c0_seq1:49-429(-)
MDVAKMEVLSLFANDDRPRSQTQQPTAVAACLRPERDDAIVGAGALPVASSMLVPIASRSNSSFAIFVDEDELGAAPSFAPALSMGSSVFVEDEAMPPLQISSSKSGGVGLSVRERRSISKGDLCV